MNRISALFLLTLFCWGCGNRPLNITDYIQYVRDPSSGLLMSAPLGGFEFSLQYEPAEYLALKELRSEEITPERFNKVLDKFEDHLYFDLSISQSDIQAPVLNPGDSAVYESRLHYFSFKMNEDLYIVANQDTIPCLLYQFVNSHGISPDCHFELMFEKPENLEESNASMVFIYQDSILGVGKLTIPISYSLINNVPRLKI